MKNQQQQQQNTSSKEDHHVDQTQQQQRRIKHIYKWLNPDQINIDTNKVKQLIIEQQQQEQKQKLRNSDKVNHSSCDISGPGEDEMKQKQAFFPSEEEVFQVYNELLTRRAKRNEQEEQDDDNDDETVERRNDLEEEDDFLSENHKHFGLIQSLDYETKQMILSHLKKSRLELSEKDFDCLQ